MLSRCVIAFGLSALLLTNGALAASTWPMSLGNAQRTGSSQSEETLIRATWHARIGRGGAFGGEGGSSFSGGLLVAGLIDRVVAISPADGHVVWTRTDTVGYANAPAIVDGIVILADLLGTVHSLRLSDGSELWNARLMANATGNPIVVDGKIIVPTEKGVGAINASDGTRLWFTESTRAGNLASGGGLVVFGTEGATGDAGTIRALSLNGTEVWQQEVSWTPRASPLLSDGRVIVSGREARAYNLTAGGELWRATLPGAGVLPPAFAKGHVIVPDVDYVVALDPRTGAKEWETKLPAWTGAAVAAQGDRVIVADSGGAITTIDLATGRVLARVHTGASVETSAPTVAGSEVFVWGQHQDERGATIDDLDALPIPDDPHAIPFCSPFLTFIVVVAFAGAMRRSLHRNRNRE